MELNIGNQMKVSLVGHSWKVTEFKYPKSPITFDHILDALTYMSIILSKGRKNDDNKQTNKQVTRIRKS